MGKLEERGFKREIGLKRLAMLFLGVYVEKDKSMARSDWDAVDLSERQISYAATDAIVCQMIAGHFLDKRQSDIDVKNPPLFIALPSIHTTDMERSRFESAQQMRLERRHMRIDMAYQAKLSMSSTIDSSKKLLT
jgi:hypothetical protein